MVTVGIRGCVVAVVVKEGVIVLLLLLEAFMSSMVCDTLPFIIRQVPPDGASELERAAIRFGPSDVGDTPSMLPDLKWENKT